MINQATVTTKEVATLLRAADGMNRDQEARRNATSRLREVQKLGGFMAGLVEVWAKADDDMLRHVAIIQVKNNARWFFSKKAKEDIANIEAERMQVRKHLLEGYVKEPNYNMAQQAAASLAKVARGEWIKKNSSLVTKCCEMMSQPDKGIVFKGCLLSYEVLNEIASLRIAANFAGFNEIAEKAISVLFPIWQNACATSFEGLKALTQKQCSASDVLSSLTLLKFANGSLQKLLISGPKKKELSGKSAEFLRAVIQLLEIFGLQVYGQIPENNADLCSIKERIGEILKDAQKLVLDYQLKNPSIFADFLTSYLEFSMKVISDPSNPNIMLTFGFEFIKKIYVCKDYMPASAHNKNKNRRGPVARKKESSFPPEVAQRVAPKKESSFPPEVAQRKRGNLNRQNKVNSHAVSIVKTFFTDENVAELCQVMIQKYLILQEKDIIKWNEDPEDFFQDSLITFSTAGVRQVCADFLKRLMKNKKQIIGPKIVQWFVSALQQPASDEAAVYREAMYHAVGLVYFDLHHPLREISFNISDFYQKYLRPDMDPKNHHFIVRRSVWLAAQVKDDLLRNRQLTMDAFQIIAEILLKHPDIVVRMTCVRALRTLLDDSQCDNSSFFPVASNACQGLLQILNNLSNVTNITFVIECLNLILNRFGQDMGNDAVQLLSLVRTLWDNFDHDLVRSSVVGVLTSIVKSLKSTSEKCHEFLIPVLEYVTDFTQAQRLYLTEAGLELWCAVLQNSSKMTPQLLKLFERWVFCMQRFQDYHQQCLVLLKSYLLLGKLDFIQTYQDPIRQILAEIVKTIDTQNMSSLSQTLCLFIQMFPDKSPIFLQPVLEQCFVNFLELSAPIQTREVKPYLLIFGRLFFENFNGAIELVTHFQQRESRQILQDFMKRYMSYAEKIRVPFEMKICILALARFAQLDLPNDIYQRMIPILFKCGVTCRVSDLAVEENRGPPLTEPQRQLQLVLLDRSTKADLLQQCRQATEIIMEKMGKNEFKRNLKKIPDHILDKFHRTRRR